MVNRTLLMRHDMVGLGLGCVIFLIGPIQHGQRFQSVQTIARPQRWRMADDLFDQGIDIDFLTELVSPVWLWKHITGVGDRGPFVLELLQVKSAK